MCRQRAAPATETGLPADPPRLTRAPGPRPGVGIVHLGLGAFFRAHGALYVAEAMAQSGGDWGIVGVSLVRPDQRDRLAPQGFAYTALELGPDGETPQVVDVVAGRARRPRGPRGRRRRAWPTRPSASSRLTVTEKGYCHDPATGRLNRDHPDIVHDLAQPAGAALGPGLPRPRPRPPPRRRRRPLHRAHLRQPPRQRRAWSAASCSSSAAWSTPPSPTGSPPRAPSPAPWSTASSPPPSPRTSSASPRSPAASTSRRCCTSRSASGSSRTDFVGGARPDLGAVGVQLVADVRPFELMKLRMLNGTHSSLAYLGYLAGHETIADTVADPVFAGFVRRLWTRGDHPDPRPAARRGPRPLRRRALRPLRQPGDPPPHLADRHGRQPEAAPAHPRHPRRQPRRRPPEPRPDARRRRLDALRRRHRRDRAPRSTSATRSPPA